MMERLNLSGGSGVRCVCLSLFSVSLTADRQLVHLRLNIQSPSLGSAISALFTSFDANADDLEGGCN